MINFHTAAVALTSMIYSSANTYGSRFDCKEIKADGLMYISGASILETDIGLLKATIYRGTSMSNSERDALFQYMVGDSEFAEHFTCKTDVDDESRNGVLLSEIIRLFLLGENLNGNLVILHRDSSGFRYTYTRNPDGVGYNGNTLSVTESMDKGIESIKRIVFDEGHSFVINAEGIPETITSIFENKMKEDGYTTITRFRDNTAAQLREFYGEKFILKLSKFCYYVNGKGMILFLTTPRGSNGTMLDAHFWDRDIASRSAEKWLLDKNMDYMLSIIGNESLRNMIQKLTTKEVLDNDLNAFLDYVIRSMSKYGKDIINQNLKAITETALDQHTSKGGLFVACKDLIKTRSVRLTESMKENQNALIGLRYQIVRLDEGGSDIENSEATKATALLERMKNNGTVLDYTIDEERQQLVIHTNWLRQRFVDIGNLNKRYLNNEISSRYRSLLSGQHNLTTQKELKDAEINKIINQRNNYINTMLNYEDKYYFAIMPATIVIQFGASLEHGFGYEFFHSESSSVSAALINGHSRYFSTNVSYRHCTLSRGCLGSSDNLFTTTGSDYNLTKYISLCIQYLQTFIPFDTAGDSSLVNNPIIDNDGKVVSFPTSNEKVGMYINMQNIKKNSPAFIKNKDDACEVA